MADVAWSVEAIEDLEVVRRHLTVSSPSFANIYVKRLARAVDDLGRLPGMGKVVLEVERPDVREIFYQNYRLLYRFRDNAVVVFAVRRIPQELHRILQPLNLGLT